MTEVKNFIELLENMKKKKHIKDMISFFYDYGYEGWEKWLQMELLFAINQEWGDDHYKELQYEVDQRKSDKFLNQLDIVYRRPKTSTSAYVGVELKVMSEPHRCIQGAIEDLKKIANIKSSNWDFRSIIAVAVYLPEQREASASLSVARKYEIVKFGNFEIAVFDWETTPSDELKLPGFKEWLLKQDL